MKQIEQKNEMEKREIIYDFIRVISCFLVIGIHSTDLIKISSQIGSYTWWIGNLIQAIVRMGLPMFTLLSGVLILNSKEQKVSTFYFKRFIRVVIPLYIYSLIYILIFEYNYSLKLFNPITFVQAIKIITQGPVCYHLWYLYMIIGIYLCAPYIKKMCQSLTDKECHNLFILIFCIGIIKYLLPGIGITVGITNFIFVDWTLIFLLGYLITRDAINKNYKIIYFLGIISFVFYLIAQRWFTQITNMNDLSITMMFEVLGLYLFLYRNKHKICANKTINKIILTISKYSLEIYLIHAYVLDVCMKMIFNYTKLNIIFSSFIFVIIVPIISFFTAFIVHNIIIVNVEKPIKKLTYRINQIISKTKGNNK